MSEINLEPDELPIPGSETTKLVRELVLRSNATLAKYAVAINGIAENLAACHKAMQKQAEAIIQLRDGMEKLESLNASHADSLAGHGQAIARILAHLFPEEAKSLLTEKEPVN